MFSRLASIPPAKAMGVISNLLVFTLYMTSFLSSASGQQTCQSNFVSSLYQCLGNRSLDRENFLWVARDGALGSEPDDVQSFTSRVCIEKLGLFQCTKTALDNIIAQTEAQCPQNQKDSLTKLFKSIFKTVNKKCENACRPTFRQTLTKCYTDMDFGPIFLLFNVTQRRDAILGNNKTEIQRFCQVHSDIVQCMKSAALDCNDSPFLLRLYSLDLNALNDTYGVLCNHTEVYQDATKCFRDPTPSVIQCRNTVASQVAILEAQLEDINISEAVFKEDLCRLRFDQIQCEMNAIKTENDTSVCHDVIVGMRRQQECTLLPGECALGNRDRLSALCRNSDYLIPDREAYRGSGADSTASSYYVTSLLSSLIVVCFLRWVDH